MKVSQSMAFLLFMAALPGAVTAQSAISVDWQWKASHRCADISPELKLAGLPDGVRKVSVRMNDIDFQNKDHGGGVVDIEIKEGQATIPEGRLPRYLGPCPNNFSSFGHDYMITVKALAEDGTTVLASGQKTQTFSAKTAQ